MNTPARGSLLGIEHLEAKEILGLLKLARRMNPLKARPLLRGKRVVLLFYENSTRTRSSFEFAAKSLGAMTTLLEASSSSIEKGESVLDTAYTLRAVGADCIVVRHPFAGAPHLMAEHLDIPVINAGDGMHEHPSQALLDAYTILKHKRSFQGLHVTIVGDILHSRVARSSCHLLTKFGVKIALCRPVEFAPEVAATLALCGVVLLWGLRDYEHRRAINALEARTYEGVDPLRVSAYPSCYCAYRRNAWPGTRSGSRATSRATR